MGSKGSAHHQYIYFLGIACWKTYACTIKIVFAIWKCKSYRPRAMDNIHICCIGAISIAWWLENCCWRRCGLEIFIVIELTMYRYPSYNCVSHSIIQKTQQYKEEIWRNWALRIEKFLWIWVDFEKIWSTNVGILMSRMIATFYK